MHACLLFNLQLYPFGQSENDAVLPADGNTISSRIILCEDFILCGQTFYAYVRCCS